MGKDRHGMLLKGELCEELPDEMNEIDADKRHLDFQYTPPDVVSEDIMPATTS
jgi:hypothetical protein